MFVLNQSKSLDDENLHGNFVQLALGLAQLLQGVGLKTQAGLEGFPYFGQLNNQEKATAVERLQFYYDLCLEQLIDGQSLRDSKRFTWRALVKLGLTPRSDLLDLLEEDDIVEIYNEDHVQLFRNLEFFDICTYSIEELFCIQWWRLFSREENVSGEILKITNDLYSKKYPSGISYPLPPHWVEESLSAEPYRLDFVMKFMAPLSSNKKVNAVICFERVSLRKVHS